MSLVLVDSSIWVAHFRRANTALVALLQTDRVLSHPLVVIELACGTPPAPRDKTLRALKLLRQANLATNDEVLAFIEMHNCYDVGCGAVDVALLAAVTLTPGSMLWTADTDLNTLAARLGLAFRPNH